MATCANKIRSILDIRMKLHNSLLYRHCFLSCSCACFVVSVFFSSMHSLLASFTCSHACHVLSIQLLSLCTVCSLVSDALLLAFCNLSLAFIGDLTLSGTRTQWSVMRRSNTCLFLTVTHGTVGGQATITQRERIKGD